MIQTIASNTEIKCSACGYDLRGLASAGRCPECGQEIAKSERRWSKLAVLGNPRFLRAAAVLWISAQLLSSLTALSDQWANPHFAPPIERFVLDWRAPVIWPRMWWTNDVTGSNGSWRAAEAWLGLAAAITWNASFWLMTYHRKAEGSLLRPVVRWSAAGLLFIGIVATWWWVPGSYSSRPMFNRLWINADQFDPRNAFLGMLIALYLWRMSRPSGDRLLAGLALASVVTAAAGFSGTILIWLDWPPGFGTVGTHTFWYLANLAIILPVIIFLAFMVRLWRIADRAIYSSATA